LYGDGAGGFSNVTIGTGVSFAGGTLSATGTGGTVTSVAALTLGTTGTDLSSTVANGTTTPVITLQVPTASATNRGALSAADWTTFNGKAPAVTYTTGYVPFGQGTTTPNQSANLFWDNANTRLGVGTASPTAALDIRGSGNFGNGTITNIIGQDGTNAYVGTASAYPLALYTNGVIRANFSTTGHVGINCTPFSATNATNLIIYNATTPALYLQNSTSGQTSTDGFSLGFNGSDVYINNREAGNMYFYVNGSQRMQIFSSGGFSIGNNTDPGAANLSVTGTIRTQGYTVATLPAAGTVGRKAYVTDALAPTFLAVIVGGGAVKCPVFDNGTAWVAG
jgi:hypothetical protein